MLGSCVDRLQRGWTHVQRRLLTVCCPVLLIISPCVAQGLTWTQVCSPLSPTSGNFPAMAYDAARAQIVLFGGQNLAGNTTSNQTWIWNGMAWTQAFPATSPPGRGSQAMAYDAAHNQIVMFGGAIGGEIANDTWVWDGSTWTQVFPVASPSPRLHAAMVFDNTLQKILLIGGSNGSPTAFAETWAWDGTNWTMLVAPPAARENFAAAYDSTRDETVVFGGVNQGVYLADTELFNGSTWTATTPVPSPPTPRQDDGVVFDGVLGQTVLFGGAGPSNTPAYNDTWAWDGTNWAQSFPATSPPGRSGHAMAYDSATSQIVVFGGVNSSGAFTDTWVYGSTTVVNSCPSVSTGTIQVITNLTTATFTISGPATYTGTGERFTQIGAPPGAYTITFGPVPGYVTPPAQTQTLRVGGTLNFTTTYQTCAVQTAVIDDSDAKGVIGATKSGLDCAWTFTVMNLQPFLWLDITETPIGAVSAVPADAISNSYAQAGVLAPGKSITYSVQFSEPSQSVTVFANLTGGALDKAMNMNIVQAIINAVSISPKLPVGTIELGIEDVGQVLEVLSQMPHFEAAVTDFTHTVCFGPFCLPAPQIAAGVGQLIAFSESPTEPELLRGLLSQLGVDAAETTVTTITSIPGALAAVLLEVVSNVQIAFFGNTAGSVMLTAQ
jgi:hypothetical protein